jgi:putative phosphoribosyl transferase
VSPQELSAAQAHARVELQRRLQALRGDRSRVELAGRTAVVVDDGIATGATARAACRVARALGAARVVLTAPVGSPDAVAGLSDVADDVVCLERPAQFGAVGQFYEDFTPTSDHDVAVLLDQAAALSGTRPPTRRRSGADRAWTLT